jgi:peptidoglycan hydrolase-like protein with peptidoglycan-binding domain
MRTLMLAAASAIALTLASRAVAQQSYAARQALAAQKAQEKLKSDGVYQGKIDGVVGPETQQALKDYQKQHNLQQTGQLDEPTEVLLGIVVQSGSSAPDSSRNAPSPGVNTIVKAMRISPRILLMASGLVGCAVPPPTGPSVMALPAQGKTLAEFQQDDLTCRNYASARISNLSPAQAAQQSGVNSAVLGTLLGTAAGALLGAAGGRAGAGAAVGAGGGLLMGSVAGAGAAHSSSVELQRRYDVAYLQCMAASGESVPTQPYAPVPGYYYYAPYPAS